MGNYLALPYVLLFTYRVCPGARLRGGDSVISNSEMIRIRRQMQRRIRDVVAERRRTRQLDPPHSPIPMTTPSGADQEVCVADNGPG
ncbi:hypothetical protein GCM10027614_60380 [Micromonospora vulcania]